jgi:hypothetical protein
MGIQVPMNTGRDKHSQAQGLFFEAGIDRKRFIEEEMFFSSTFEMVGRCGKKVYLLSR